jgi:two-component system LytT family response regulator
MRSIIIDDELHCRKRLSILLSKYCPHVEVIETCADGKTGAKLIEEHDPDLVFLDIEMPGMNGFDFLETVSHHKFGVIFTTAYNEYAIKAIRHSALDYLLKPVDKDELVKAIERAEIFRSSNAAQNISKLLESIGSRKNERIALPSMEGIMMVDIKDILYCESENNYTYIHLVDGSKLLVSKTLKSIEAMIGSEDIFFRVHHSYLVNMKCVQQYIKGDGGEVLLKNGKRLMVSRTRKSSFLNQLGKL